MPEITCLQEFSVSLIFLTLWSTPFSLARADIFTMKGHRKQQNTAPKHEEPVPCFWKAHADVRGPFGTPVPGPSNAREARCFSKNPNFCVWERGNTTGIPSPPSRLCQGAAGPLPDDFSFPRMEGTQIVGEVKPLILTEHFPRAELYHSVSSSFFWKMVEAQRILYT